MTAADHTATVAELLAGLGDTPDAVADTLRARGIKGVREHCCACPIAELLKRNGIPNPHVECARVWPDPDSMWKVSTRMPAAVQVFIDRFDEGVYLDLGVEP